MNFSPWKDLIWIFAIRGFGPLFTVNSESILAGLFLILPIFGGRLTLPRLDTSLASEVPNPIYIRISRGESDLKQVFCDILALTKLNYNACRLGESEPVTIRYSDAVGEILVSNPTVTHRSPKFKFYIWWMGRCWNYWLHFHMSIMF